MRVERLEWDGTDPRSVAATLRTRGSSLTEADVEVGAIVAEVRERGDDAVRELTARLDAPEADAEELQIQVDPDEIERARSAAGPKLVEALEAASRNLETVARAELAASADTTVELPDGQSVSILWKPVEAAGIYAPGGRAPYPSSVLMGCVPARVAGVERIAVATPPGPDGSVHPAVLTACAIAGASEVCAVGGAQAIAALAFGTASIRPVDVIAGPGNRYVNAAKRLVFGIVGVDGIAGPSEVVVILDTDTNVRWAAFDLLAQAEHGRDGFEVAVSDDAGALDRLQAALEELSVDRPTVAEARIVLVKAPDLQGALALADAVAPEHLELMLEGAAHQYAADRVAGCVFRGPLSAVAFGDYAAGSNHILPTGGAARFGGPLGVGTFRRRTGLVEMSSEAVSGLAPHVGALARAEGFDVHAESAEARAE